MLRHLATAWISIARLAATTRRTRSTAKQNTTTAARPDTLSDRELRLLHDQMVNPPVSPRILLPLRGKQKQWHETGPIYLEEISVAPIVLKILRVCQSTIAVCRIAIPLQDYLVRLMFNYLHISPCCPEGTRADPVLFRALSWFTDRHHNEYLESFVSHYQRDVYRCPSFRANRDYAPPFACAFSKGR